MLDLSSGINFHISGELGRYNSLPVEDLVEIAGSLQELVYAIAQNDISHAEVIDLNNFRLELFSFQAGSAVPGFRFTPQLQGVVSGDILEQRSRVSTQVDALMRIANEGRYQRIAEIYQNPPARNTIVDNLYNFVHSFGDAPVSVLDSSHSQLYSISKFRPEIKKALISTIVPPTKEEVADYRVGRVKITTRGNKVKKRISEIYESDDNTIAYSPQTLIHEDKIYELNFPLHSRLAKEDDFYVIHNEMFDIIGTGVTEDEAKRSFAEEFDFAYSRYNQLPDDRLTIRIRTIKHLLNYIVKSLSSL